MEGEGMREGEGAQHKPPSHTPHRINDGADTGFRQSS